MPRGRFSRVLLVMLTLSVAANVALWRTGTLRAVRAPGDVLEGQGGIAGVLSAEDSGNGTVSSRSGAAASGVAATLAFLASIEDEHLRPAREIADAWWSGGGDYQSAYAGALSQGLASMRDELARRFGNDVKDDPALRWLYRPLDPLYWFLSSDEQLAIQNLRLERDKALQAAAREASRPAAGASAPNAMAVDEGLTLGIMREYQSDLAALLHADALLELELRDSAIAQQLRASGVSLSESEFRDAYTLLASLQRETADPVDAAAVRDRLRGLLGNRRFAALWAARDPMFAEISVIAERHSLAEATALSAYELINEFQDRRSELARTAGLHPDRAAQDARALADDERAALSRLVGEAVADEIVRGRARLSYQLFSGSRESQGGRFR